MHGPGRTVAAASAPAAPPATAWQQVLSQIGPDGSISKQTALEAFVLAVGPLPGVRRPAGPAQVIEDGSGPVRWLLGYYSQLSAAQQAAVRRLLRLPVTASAQPARPGTGPATLNAVIRPAAPASPGPGQLTADQALEQQAAAEIASRLGVQLTLAVQVVENQTEQTVKGQPALAYTTCTNATDGATGPAPAAKCKISINPSAHQLPGGDGGSYFKGTMIHEVFHCFEAQLAGTIGRFNSAVDAESWLIEGAAEWVESDFVTDPSTTSNWLKYLENPSRPLFERTYDAIGWLGHLYPGGGVSPWKVLPAMIRVPGSAAAYDAATAGASPDFLDTEASVFFEVPRLPALVPERRPGHPAGYRGGQRHHAGSMGDQPVGLAGAAGHRRHPGQPVRRALLRHRGQPPADHPGHRDHGAARARQAAQRHRHP